MRGALASGAPPVANMSKINDIVSSLPITSRMGDIVDAIQENPVVLITAETGAGKSTQVAKILARDHGYRVLCTQPRRLAASSLADRVAAEWPCELGEEVGYKTSVDSAMSESTRCLYVTDGLALVRELMGSARGYDVLIVDEIHEWNINVEVLLAWALHTQGTALPFKLVIMSATLDAAALSAFCGGAPIINVPGRMFPVEEQQRCTAHRCLVSNMAADIVRLVDEGRNVLAFLPGKRDINSLTDALQRDITDGVSIVPLHGEQSREDQRLAFVTGARKVVLATNIAQTSITIEDVDAVVDSGMLNRTEVYGGVEGLYTKECSKADSRQRAGRAGRTRPGIYIDHCPTTFGRREEYQTAEIQRSILDQVTLRLLIAGVDIRKLRLFHAPEKASVEEAYKTLQAIGAVDASGSVTEIGRQIAKLPVGVREGRALIAARKRGVTRMMINAVAVYTAGSIIDRFQKDDNGTPLWRSGVLDNRSDIVNQAQLLQWAAHNQRDWKSRYLFAKNVRRALDVREQLIDRLPPTQPDTGTRDDLVKAWVDANIDRVHIIGSISRLTYNGRRIAEESVIRTSPECVVGTPFDISTKGRVIPLLTWVSEVPAKWLPELLGDRVTKSSFLKLDEHWAVTATVVYYLDGKNVYSEERPATEAETRERLAYNLKEKWQYYADTSQNWSHGPLKTLIEKYAAVHQYCLRTGKHMSGGRVDFTTAGFLSSTYRNLADLAAKIIGNTISYQDALDKNGHLLDFVADSEVPDTLDVLGTSYKIEYRSNGPTVELDPYKIYGKEITEATYTLPDGRVVLFWMNFRDCEATMYYDVRSVANHYISWFRSHLLKEVPDAIKSSSTPVLVDLGYCQSVWYVDGLDLPTKERADEYVQRRTMRQVLKDNADLGDQMHLAMAANAVHLAKELGVPINIGWVNGAPQCNYDASEAYVGRLTTSIQLISMLCDILMCDTAKEVLIAYIRRHCPQWAVPAVMEAPVVEQIKEKNKEKKEKKKKEKATSTNNSGSFGTLGDLLREKGVVLNGAVQ